MVVKDKKENNPCFSSSVSFSFERLYYDQSSGVSRIIISVYDLDGKGQIPGYGQSLGPSETSVFLHRGVGVGEWRRSTLGSVFYLKTMLPAARRNYNFSLSP